VSAAPQIVPPQRSAAFATLAKVTQSAAVVVFCRDSVVAHQYRCGVAAAGGKPENLHFLHHKRGAAGAP